MWQVAPEEEVDTACLRPRLLSASEGLHVWNTELLYFAVHGPTQVKITDFGLAKLLECDEESYEATGGKVIKLLRCIMRTIGL